MSPTYAAKTSVPTEQSRAEIERTLVRYGATAFAYGWNRDRATVEFAAYERRVRFMLPLPDRADPEFYKRTPEQASQRWEQACRQRWRALALVVKAKLEAVEAGITDFESEFLAHIVLPDNSTAGQWLRPQIAKAYESGRMPEMLPALGSGR